MFGQFVNKIVTDWFHILNVTYWFHIFKIYSSEKKKELLVFKIYGNWLRRGVYVLRTLSSEFLITFLYETINNDSISPVL